MINKYCRKKYAGNKKTIKIIFPIFFLTLNFLFVIIVILCYIFFEFVSSSFVTSVIVSKSLLISSPEDFPISTFPTTVFFVTDSKSLFA